MNKIKQLFFGILALACGQAVNAQDASADFNPAPNLTAEEITGKVYEANPYTLYRKGAEAEYCSASGNGLAFGGGPRYFVLRIDDARVENGLYVIYSKPMFLNKKHQPSKGIPESFKNTARTTEIDINGTYHWTFDITSQLPFFVTGTRGYAALIGSDLTPASTLKTNKLILNTKTLLGTTKAYSYDYTGLRVVGFETITVPAGTFECLKISGTITTDNRNDDYYPRTEHTFWLARGVGLVRHDIYYKNKLFKTLHLNKLTNN